MVRSATAASLLELIRSRRAKTGVIGLGYVGLPLAVEFGRAGFAATGIDLDIRKVNAINEGRSYIDDVSTEHVAELKAANRLRATTDFDVLAELDTINICVPTPLRKTKDPDMSFIVAAAEEIAARLRPGQLIILESTTYPGTTDELVLPMLEKGGLKAGKDFFLAFSPERVDPSNRAFNTHNIPKVIGGVTEDCTALASALYEGAISKIVPVSSPRVAEMVKLLENTFRAVNIGMVNELALMCDRMGIDVWEVVKAAATKPFGFMPFYPGPGLGGHCIPVDPFYLSWKARAVRVRSALHRARGRRQRQHAALRRVARERGAQRCAQAAQRLEGARGRRRLQEGRGRHPRIAGARPAASAARPRLRTVVYGSVRAGAAGIALGQRCGSGERRHREGDRLASSTAS